MEKRPIQVDGEPWEQKKCHLDILYHGQVPMLTHPVTEMQEAMGVMADSLEWAKTSGLIDERQYQLILSQYQTRMRNLHKTVRPRSDSFFCVCCDLQSRAFSCPVKAKKRLVQLQTRKASHNTHIDNKHNKETTTPRATSYTP